MSVTRKLICEVLIASFAAAVVSTLLVIFQFAFAEISGSPHEGRSITAIVALAAAGAFPVIFMVSFAYISPLAIGLRIARFQNVVRRMRSGYLVALLGFLIGVLYWAVLDAFLPWYPANRDQIEIKIASYMGSGVAIAVLCFIAFRNKSNGEQVGAGNPLPAQ